MNKFDQIMKSVNHRGYCSVAPENTLVAYRMSKQKGFYYVEADISFTSDGIPVLSHDATIDRCSNGTGSISEMTYDELRSYDFGSWKSEEFAGEKIPNFKEFLKLCKSIGLHPYIELKSNGSYTSKQIRLLVDTVKRYGMQQNVTWISFNIDFLYTIGEYDNTARIGYLQTPNASRISHMKTIANYGCEVFFDMNYANITDEIIQMVMDANIPLEVWTVNSTDDLFSLDPYVTGVTTDNLICGKEIFNRYMI